MKCEPTVQKLTGEVQADETYIGGKPRKRSGQDVPTIKAEKTPIVAMVQTDGDVRSTVVDRVNANTLHWALQDNVDRNALIVTDESRSYIPIINGYFAGGHQTVNHSVGEYVNSDGFTTNTAESFFALIKRGHYGVYHKMSKQHLQRYCEEFAFRWNGRKLMDIDRRDLAIRAQGKRLFLFKASADA